MKKLSKFSKEDKERRVRMCTLFRRIVFLDECESKLCSRIRSHYSSLDFKKYERAIDLKKTCYFEAYKIVERSGIDQNEFLRELFPCRVFDSLSIYFRISKEVFIRTYDLDCGIIEVLPIEKAKKELLEEIEEERKNSTFHKKMELGEKELENLFR